jgi:hypothetical protein
MTDTKEFVIKRIFCFETNGFSELFIMKIIKILK